MSSLPTGLWVSFPEESRSVRVMICTSLSTSFFFASSLCFSLLSLSHGANEVLWFLFLFLIHPQKGQIQHYTKAELSRVFAFAAPAIWLWLVIKRTMFLLFREVPYWVSWFNVSWQLSTMQPLAHQDIRCQWTSRLIPLLVSLLSSARFCCIFLKVASLIHFNVGIQVAAMRNWRS